MEKDLSLIEIIGLAIRSEEDAAEFYGSMAKLVKNELVRNKFEILAKEEVGHRHILVELYKKMTGEKKAPPQIPGKPLTAEGRMPPMKIEAFEELLQLAIKRERMADDFYRRAAGIVVEYSAKRTFDYLADIEHGHEMLLKTELEVYRKDNNWYAEKPDVQLVGP